MRAQETQWVDCTYTGWPIYNAMVVAKVCSFPLVCRLSYSRVKITWFFALLCSYGPLFCKSRGNIVCSFLMLRPMCPVATGFRSAPMFWFANEESTRGYILIIIMKIENWIPVTLKDASCANQHRRCNCKKKLLGEYHVQRQKGKSSCNMPLFFYCFK